MKICLVCSHGGHLIEMLQLSDAFNGKEVVLVTYDEIFTRKLQNSIISRKYLIEDLTLRLSKYKNTPIFGSLTLIVHMFMVCLRELKIILKEKPDVVISTGSEIAIPMFFLAKIFRKKCIFIESLCRIEEISGTGKLVYKISDVFLVQWPCLLDRYERAIYKGNVLNFVEKSEATNKENMVFVTIGTSPFPRLIGKMDEIAGKIGKKVIMQIGNTEYKPRNAEYFKFHPSYEVIKKLNERAKVVVCHGGVGSIITALKAGTNIIAVPRFKKYKEHYDDHQLQILTFLAKKGIVEVVYDVNELEDVLKQKLAQGSRCASENDVEDKNTLVHSLRELINN